MKKNKIKNIILILIVSLIFIPNVYADTTSFCQFNEIRRILKIVGWLILLIKIFVPLLLIIFTMMDFAKAITAKDEVKYKELTKIVIKRAIAAVCVFLIPTAINIILNIADDGKINTSVKDCSACLNSPSTCKTTKALTLPKRPKMIDRGTLGSEGYSSIGYNWKWTGKKLVYLDSSGNTIKNKTFKVNGVSYKADSTGKVTPDVSNPIISTDFTDYTNAIVNAHRYDFNVDNFDEVMKSYGGYNKYIKSLGGVFTKYADFKGKVKSTTELQEVAEYVWGIMTIWGFDYANYQADHYGKWRADFGVGNDAFYPSSSDHRLPENYPEYGIDRVASGSGNGITTNCGNGVDWLLRKAGLFNSSFPSTYDLEQLKNISVKIITDPKDLQPGDIIQYFTGSINRNGSASSWWSSGYFHVNIVMERDNKKGTITEYDSGHYFTNSGRHKYVRKIGDWPYEWANDWVGMRLFNLK